MSKALKLLILFLGIYSSAWATPPTVELCGNGYDDLTSGNTFGSCPAGWHNAFNSGIGCDRDCISVDKDKDGYTTDGTQNGLDCDDTNGAIFPGIYIQGTGGAGTLKKCLTTGSYSADSNLSAFTCKTGSGIDMWVKPTGVTTGGCGAFGSECDYTCFSNTGAACYHAPAAGDCFIFRTGNYTTTWSAGTRQIYVNGKSGTSTNPILIIAAPGESTAPVIVGQGTAPVEVIPVQLDGSSYWKLQGVTIQGSTGFSNSGIYINTGGNFEVVGTKIFNIDGCRANNVACIKTNGGFGVNLHNNLLFDCYDHDTSYALAGCHVGSQENSRLVVTFQGSTDADWSVGYFTPAVSTTATGQCFNNKHGDPTGPFRARGNTLWNCNVGALGFDSANSIISNNVVSDSDFATELRDFGGGAGQTYFQNELVSNNTFINTQGNQYIPSQSSQSITDVLYSGNVAIDARITSHPSDGTEGDIRIDNYGSGGRGAATTYADVITAAKLHFDHNCYYESGGQTPFFDLFGDAGLPGSAKYSSCASWFAAPALNSNETASVCSNPSLDYKQVSAVTGCTRGWSYGLYAASPTPTPTPSPSTKRKGVNSYYTGKGQAL